MTSLAKRIATALICCLGGGGTLGCELISKIERSKIPDRTGAGGQGGSTTTTTTSTSTGSGDGGEGGAGGIGGAGGSGGTGGISGQSSTGGSAAVCGDGTTVSGSEACDDGNTVPGDGCDPQCKPELGFTCVGSPSVCTSTCGDGTRASDELCDDGNLVDLDGCSSACKPDSFTEAEPNDTAATASGSFAPSALLVGAINPGTDVDYFKIQLSATSDLKIQTFDAAGPSSCAGIDTVVTLIGADGTTTLIQRDQGGVNGCGAIDSTRAADGGARHLPAGAYFIKVEDYQNNTVIPGYTVLVTLDALCGDGKTEGAETCDGGAGCTATCDHVQVCGDGVVDAPEQCDDGNAASSDGCSATCQLETKPEIEPNNTAATASGIFTPHALLRGTINPGADVDYYAITLPATADLTIETFDGGGPGACVGIDTQVTLFGSDGTTMLASQDDGGVGTCSRIDATSSPGARHLAAGSYFVKVEDFGNNTVIPAYTLELTTAALCGDGKTEGSEECDGGAGCTATCDRIATCGDGFVDAPEACDDGNTAANDGCSATCLIESLAELEPNDDLAGADAAASAASSVKITGTTILTGAISPALDQDWFQMVLAQPTVVRLETFDASGADCTIETTLRIRDSAGVELHADDNSGIFTCSALVVPLPAGSYYVTVEERTGSQTIAAYVLQAKFEASAGAEVEPDDLATTATPLPGSDVVASGDHAVNTDADFYAITVPAGKSIRAEIVEGDAETCELSDVDSYLTLFDAGGVALGNDDDSGRGFCSLIDGTGSSPADAYAHHLAAGTYYLLVEASPSAQDAADTTGQFAYRLAITLR